MTADSREVLLCKDAATLRRHITENSKQIFPEKELCGLCPSLSHSCVCVFPQSVCLFCCRKIFEPCLSGRRYVLVAKMPAVERKSAVTKDVTQLLMFPAAVLWKK